MGGPARPARTAIPARAQRATVVGIPARTTGACRRTAGMATLATGKRDVGRDAGSTCGLISMSWSPTLGVVFRKAGAIMAGEKRTDGQVATSCASAQILLSEEVQVAEVAQKLGASHSKPETNVY